MKTIIKHINGEIVGSETYVEGVYKDTLVAKIIQKADAYTAAIGYYVGTRQKSIGRTK